MEYAYEKLMAEEKLTMADLPEDAKVGIESIKKMERITKMMESKGKKMRPSTLSKVRAFDKWIVREILDKIEEKNTNSSAPPVEPEKIIEEIKDDANKSDKKNESKGSKKEDKEEKKEEKKDEVKDERDHKGVAIENELKALYDADKRELTIDELKSSAPKAYSVVFDNYTDDGDNGIECSEYSLTEVKEKVFKISKN